MGEPRRPYQPVFCRPAATPFTVTCTIEPRSCVRAPARAGTGAGSARARRRTGCADRSRAADRAAVQRTSCPVIGEDALERARRARLGSSATRSRRRRARGSAPRSQVGLRERQLGVLDQRREERPPGVHRAQLAGPPRRVGPRTRAEAEPPGQVHARTGSTRTPTGSRGGPRSRRRPAARDRPGAELQGADLLDRRRAQEELREARPSRPGRATRARTPRAIRSAVGPKRRRHRRRARAPRGGQQDGVRELLEMAARDPRVAVAGERHLALLGHLEAAVDRARAAAPRIARFAGPPPRPSAPPRPWNSVSAMPRSRAHAARSRLRPVQREVRGQHPDVLRESE